MTLKNEDDQTRQFWDHEAAAFDDQPDHGLTDPVVRLAWTGLFEAWLPSRGMHVLDTGCGTGSLSVVLAALGHQVTGIDISPAMISQAERKADAAGYHIDFRQMEASNPQFERQRFNAIICRHLLWSLSNPSEVLQNWVTLLKPGGRLLLIEGYWDTDAGLHAGEIMDALPKSHAQISYQNLGNQPEFWGREIEDERYAIMAEYYHQGQGQDQ